MNAVNLIPAERRYTGVTAPGAPFLGLLAALVLALVGTVAYVGARDRVSTQQSELAHVQASTAEWSAAAARYAPAVTAARRRAKAFVRLGVLLGERYDWSVLLSQLAGVMPAHAELASLSAAAAPGGSATSAQSGAAASAPSTGTAASGITITGCAASQSAVADTMLALRRLSGVSQVTLSSSAVQGAASGGATAGGSCNLPVDFNLMLEFSPSAGLVKLLGGGQSTGGQSSAAATTGSTSTSGSGAAQ